MVNKKRDKLRRFTKKAHHIHHIILFVESKDNSFNNLITLCPSCHRKIEAKLMKERKLGGKFSGE